ncbi:hypothetical protein BHE74_00015352, partial [Ensete ventricosum]
CHCPREAPHGRAGAVPACGTSIGAAPLRVGRGQALPLVGWPWAAVLTGGHERDALCFFGLVSSPSDPPTFAPNHPHPLAKTNSGAQLKDTKPDQSWKKQKVGTRKMSEGDMAKKVVARKVGGSGKASRGTSQGEGSTVGGACASGAGVTPKAIATGKQWATELEAEVAQMKSKLEEAQATPEKARKAIEEYKES